MSNEPPAAASLERRLIRVERLLLLITRSPEMAGMVDANDVHELAEQVRRDERSNMEAYGG